MVTSWGRQYPDGPLEPPPGAEPPRLNYEAIGAFLASLLAPPAEPGPPYVHTLVPSEPEDIGGGGEATDRCPGCGELIADVPVGHSWAINMQTGQWTCRTFTAAPEG